MQFPRPGEDNGFLTEHVDLLRLSFRHWTGHDLVDPRLQAVDAARAIFFAHFVVVSHDTSPDPVFNYGNQTALALFGLPWEQFTALPSRCSAEPVMQSERASLLSEVNAKGFIDHYQGIRVAHGGQRFRIEQTTVWKVLDRHGHPHGQAAMFRHWTLLDSEDATKRPHQLADDLR